MRTPRLYIPTWEKVKDISPNWLEIDCHPAFQERWRKAIRKEAYADWSFKKALEDEGCRMKLEFQMLNAALWVRILVLPRARI